MRDTNVLISNGVDLKKSLELFGDIEAYDETLKDFMAGVNEKLTKMRIYKEQGDLTNYEIQVHSLKSDARYLGFTSLGEMAYQHELKSKENDLNYVCENYQSLINETNKFIQLINTYMGNTVIKPSVSINENVIKTQTLLVVDDSDMICNFIKRIFNDSFEVIMAKDGAQAVNYIVNNPTKVITGMLLDLNMPNVDGFAVLDYFKQNNLFNRIPVAIITANDFKEKVERAYTYPIIDIVSKPFNESNLKRVIERCMEKRHQNV